MNHKRILAILGITAFLTGCTDAGVVDYEIRHNANRFDVLRKITVINTRLDKTVYENQGLISVIISDNGARLDVIAKESDNVYTKDIVVLNQDTMYVVKDLEGTQIGDNE